MLMDWDCQDYFQMCEKKEEYYLVRMPGRLNGGVSGIGGDQPRRSAGGSAPGV